MKPGPIIDNGRINRYFSMMLHIDDDDLTPDEYRLLGHYRKIAGLYGEDCEESTKETAVATQMGVAAVRTARKALVEKGRITFQAGPNNTVRVVLIDCMAENIERYASPIKSDRASSPIKNDRAALSKVIGLESREVTPGEGKPPALRIKESDPVDSNESTGQPPLFEEEGNPDPNPLVAASPFPGTSPVGETEPEDREGQPDQNAPGIASEGVPGSLNDTEGYKPSPKPQPTPKRAKTPKTEPHFVCACGAELTAAWKIAQEAGWRKDVPIVKDGPTPARCPDCEAKRFTGPDLVDIWLTAIYPKPVDRPLGISYVALGGAAKNLITAGATRETATMNAAIFAAYKAAHNGSAPVFTWEVAQFVSRYHEADALRQAGYTPEQVTLFITLTKADAFWNGKAISMDYVVKNIAARLAAYKGAAQFPQKTLKYDPQCPHCHGTGWVDVRMTDGRKSSAPCDCRDWR